MSKLHVFVLQQARGGSTPDFGQISPAMEFAGVRSPKVRSFDSYKPKKNAIY